MASRVPPQFVQFLLDTSAPNLPIPSTFVPKHLANNIPANPIVLSAEGGYVWELKIEKNGESYDFTDGWTDVVRDVQFGVGDMILFMLVDESTFKMVVYGSDACEKILPPNVDPMFKSVISKYYCTKLRLPAKFVKLAKIEAQRTIILKNPEGEEWEIGIRLDTGYVLSSGWSDFRRSNNLSIGDECMFKFIKSENKICLAKVTKKKGPVKKPRCEKILPTNYQVQLDDDDDGDDDDIVVIDDEDGDGEDDGDDDDVVVIDDEDGDGVDDGDPMFKSVISKTHNTKLRLPAEFVKLAKIEAQTTIMLKNPEGEEWEMGIRLDTSSVTTRYVLSPGWSDFWRSNYVSIGDECIFKFIRSENKIWLAKVTKKKGPVKKPRCEKCGAVKR